MYSGEKHGSLWPLAIVMKEEGSLLMLMLLVIMMYDVRLRAVEMVVVE